MDCRSHKDVAMLRAAKDAATGHILNMLLRAAWFGAVFRRVLESEIHIGPRAVPDNRHEILDGLILKASSFFTERTSLVK